MLLFNLKKLEMCASCSIVVSSLDFRSTKPLMFHNFSPVLIVEIWSVK